MRHSLLVALTAAVAAVACSPPTAEDLVAEIIATRNNFEVRLGSCNGLRASDSVPWVTMESCLSVMLKACWRCAFSTKSTTWKGSYSWIIYRS